MRERTRNSGLSSSKGVVRGSPFHTPYATTKWLFRGRRRESAEHKRLKSIAASKAEITFSNSTVSIETPIGDRRADVLVEFDRHHESLGEGIAIEVQHKHHTKDKEAVQATFRSNEYSVLWLNSTHFDDHDVDLGAGDLSKWWAAQIPHPDEWSGYHNIIKWLRQHHRPSVERTIPFPDGLFAPEHSTLWARSLYNTYSDEGGEQTIFSAPLYDSGRTRSEIGLAVDGMGHLRVFLRKIRNGSVIEYEDDPNLRRRSQDLKQLANILSEWNAEQRQDWATRTSNRQAGNWVTVWKVDTGMCRLKLLCNAETGEPTVGLEDHYQGSVTALVDPEQASESIKRAHSSLAKLQSSIV
ncbi:hypothetical protein [Natrinema sp. SYSU A 869]|uniref:hypothetical protein n=1 Tax=Natrinema sp. SYSU A 869 TaxID=2871694 RepID=UPI001CA438C7|nr:hypothetical protein [Natrinema sp. SYSU A 869]